MGILNFFRSNRAEPSTSFESYTLEMFAEHPSELLGIQTKSLDEYKVFHEHDFEAKIIRWNRPCVDTFWFALKALLKLGAPVDGRYLEGGREFLIKSYRKSVGFHLTGKQHTLSVHTIHCALGLAISLANADQTRQAMWSTPMGRDFFVSYFDQLFGNDQGEEVVESCLAYILRHMDCVDNCMCFRESDRYAPTLTATASALWCLWQLDALPMEHLESISDFVRSLFSEYPDGSWAIRNETGEDAYLCSTYYGFRTLYSIEDALGYRTESHERILEKRDRIRDFIMLAQVESGGFAAKRGELATMIHTKDALALMQDKYDLGFDINTGFHAEVTRSYREMHAQSAYRDNSACAGFASSIYYFPNVYGTLLSLDMVEYLDILARENGLKAQPVEDASREVTDFLESCWSNTIKGFRGYSYHTDYLPPRFLDRVLKLRRLREKRAS